MATVYPADLEQQIARMMTRTLRSMPRDVHAALLLGVRRTLDARVGHDSGSNPEAEQAAKHHPEMYEMGLRMGRHIKLDLTNGGS